MEQEGNYFDKLKNKMDIYVHLVYKLSKKFPKEEIYGATSQLRRSSLSVALNYIEGCARMRPAVKLNFWEISYGSLKEAQYILTFFHKENYIMDIEYQETIKSGEEIGAMLWSAIKTLQNSVGNK